MHLDCVDHEGILALHSALTVNKGSVMDSLMTWLLMTAPNIIEKHHIFSGCNTKSCRPIIGPPVFIARREGSNSR